jgi:3-methylcrotonyl-CoA carboxylase alpha subunit
MAGVSTSSIVLRATLEGRSVEIEVPASGPVAVRDEGHAVTMDVVPLEAVGADGRLLSIGDDSGERWQATVVPVGDELWVFIDGEVFQIDVEQAQHTPTRRRARTEGGSSAPMPATVMRILVEPGQRVARGDTLLLLEAMKMELPVRAPEDGRVAAIHCKPGELVQPGVTLVEISHA